MEFVSIFVSIFIFKAAIELFESWRGQNLFIFNRNHNDFEMCGPHYSGWIVLLLFTCVVPYSV